jgi:hypothetical protein
MKIKLDDKLEFYNFDKLHEGYEFGQSFGFEVSIDYVFRPDITINQHELHLDNAIKFYSLLKHDGVIFSPLVLKFIKFKEMFFLYFDKNYNLKCLNLIMTPSLLKDALMQSL